jgi:hypothetical protein
MTTDDIPNWLQTGVMAVFGALTGAIVFLFKTSRSTEAADLKAEAQEKAALNVELKTQVQALEVESRECRKDREDLRVQVAQLSTRLEYVEKRIA